MTKLDPQRSLQLRFMGDWGGANLSRACGWMAQEVEVRTAPGTRSTIHTGRGMADNLFAVHSGQIDVAVATPGPCARMARAGKGMFKDAPLPGLRAVGSLPHNDAMLFCIPAKLGIKTFAELREAKPALKLALAPDDGISFMGIGATAVLQASGITLDDIVDWGGEIVPSAWPHWAVADVVEGRADSIVQEAIMTPWWKDMTDKVDLTFLSLEPEAEKHIEDEFGLEVITVPAGRLRGIDKDLRALSFRDWLVVVREDMRDDVAVLLATILDEESDFFESQYTRDPLELSGLDYPITAKRLADAAIPLHPGAEAYYKSVKAI